MSLKFLKVLWIVCIIATISVAAYADDDIDENEYRQRITSLRESMGKRYTLARDVYITSALKQDHIDLPKPEYYNKDGFDDKNTPLAEVVSDKNMKDKLNKLYDKRDIIVQRHVIGF